MESRTAKLRGTIQDLESFSHSLVHDLRAPLRTMHAFATLLETDSESRLTTDAAEFLHRIRIAAGRMDQLITDSLNYSKILKAELRLQPVNLGKLLRGFTPTCRHPV